MAFPRPAKGLCDLHQSGLITVRGTQGLVWCCGVQSVSRELCVGEVLSSWLLNLRGDPLQRDRVGRQAPFGGKALAVK